MSVFQKLDAADKKVRHCFYITKAIVYENNNNKIKKIKKAKKVLPSEIFNIIQLKELTSWLSFLSVKEKQVRNFYSFVTEWFITHYRYPKKAKNRKITIFSCSFFIFNVKVFVA